MKLEITNLKNVPDAIPILAAWQFEQWGYLNKGETINDRVQRLVNHAASVDLPITYVAYYDGMLAGSACIVQNDLAHHAGLFPWLGSLYVSRALRNKGIGAALVLHVAAEMKRLGYKQGYLYTPDQQDFYSKLGWQEVHKENYLGEEISVMRIGF